MATDAPVVSIRPARSSDREPVVALLFGRPRADMIAMFGSARNARRMGAGAFVLNEQHDAELRPDELHTWVAETDGAIVGVLQGSLGQHEFQISAAQVWLAVRVLGPVGIARLLPRKSARARVDRPVPAGAWYLAEVHVDDAMQGRGIGAQLLAFADDQARAAGAHSITLSTSADNPAQRLYLRHGYEITEHCRDEAFLRYTGIDGRLIMTKVLAPADV